MEGEEAVTLVFMAASLALALACWDPAVAAAAEEKTGVCIVCRAREGRAVAPEPIRATRMYEGAAYGFCSNECAAEFEKNPALYTGPLDAPPDSTLRAPLWTTAPSGQGVSSAPT